VPNYLLYWDSVEAGYRVNIQVTPDDGIEVRGIVTFVIPGSPDITGSLGYNDLVPQWSHTLAANESVHMTVVFTYHTTALSTAKVDAECRTNTTTVHQKSYHEQYPGQRGDEKFVLISAEA
jgi:hypothetical protein